MGIRLYYSLFLGDRKFKDLYAKEFFHFASEINGTILCIGTYKFMKITTKIHLLSKKFNLRILLLFLLCIWETITSLI